MIVGEFGGTSVRDREAQQRLVAIVAALRAVVVELSEFARAVVERDLAVVCLAGEGMRGRC